MSDGHDPNHASFNPPTRMARAKAEIAHLESELTTLRTQLATANTERDAAVAKVSTLLEKGGHGVICNGDPRAPVTGCRWCDRDGKGFRFTGVSLAESFQELHDKLATANADNARLGRELEEARAERDTWKANHDNQVKLRRELMDRPDLGDRAKSLQELHAHIDRLRAECLAWRAWQSMMDAPHEDALNTARAACDTHHDMGK